jgi:hypothetical protein
VPVYRKGKTIVPYVSDARIIERVHVPFASDGSRVDLIASLTLFFPEMREQAGRSAAVKPEPDDTGSALRVPGPGAGIGYPSNSQIQMDPRQIKA